MKNKDSTLKPIPYDSKMSKKEMFESVYTTILSKVNTNLGHKSFKLENLEANESQPMEPLTESNNTKPVELKRTTVTFEVQEDIGTNSAPQYNPRDKEIERKVNEYNKKLVSELLLKALTEERQKEEEREQLYMKTKDPTEKKRLEKILAFERAQSSERINLINEEISDKLKSFENKLQKQG
jgi:hypothetical protein